MCKKPFSEHGFVRTEGNNILTIRPKAKVSLACTNISRLAVYFFFSIVYHYYFFIIFDKDRTPYPFMLYELYPGSYLITPMTLHS